MSDTTIHLFVYGSLKRGLSNFARFCSGCEKIRTARVRGELYQLPIGYPILRIKPSHTLAQGTEQYADDATRLQSVDFQPDVFQSDESPWVEGEVLTFSDPESRLPLVDELEDFTPGRPSLYDRVITLAEVEETWLPVWTYVAPSGIVPAGSQRIGCSWSEG